MPPESAGPPGKPRCLIVNVAFSIVTPGLLARITNRVTVPQRRLRQGPRQRRGQAGGVKSGKGWVMSVRPSIRQRNGFFDMQAAVGITKHMGGLGATRELLSLCHVQEAHEVLDVGCGIGAGPAYVARTFGCRVVGVDLSERMIGWARRRVHEEGVADLVELRTADVLALPFPANRFDVVVCESVLAFVEDKAQAIRECVRVTRPGGYVGLNEGLWLAEPPPGMAARVRDAIGPSVPTADAWQSLWAASGLQDRAVRIRHVDPGAELRSRIGWIGWPWLLRAWGRALRLSVRDRAMRQSIRQQFAVPPEVFRFAGYGLFTGRKPAPGDAA